MQGKLTIIIPTYNVEEYVNRCVDNLRKQTYKNYSVIFIDDGSKDRTAELLDTVTLDLTNFRVIHQENKGVSSARNTGLKNIDSDTEYIAFVDADDFFDVNLFSRLVETIIHNTADMAVARTCFVDNQNNPIRKTNAYPFDDIVNLDDYDFCSTYTHYQVWGCVYKSALLTDIIFDENLFIGEDALFFVSSMDRSSKICFVNDVFYRYVISRDNSAMNSLTYKKILNEDTAFRRIEIIAEKYPRFIDSFKVWRATHAYANLVFMQENRVVDPKFKKKMQKYLREKWLENIRVLRINKVKTLIVYLSMVLSPSLFSMIHRRKD